MYKISCLNNIRLFLFVIISFPLGAFAQELGDWKYFKGTQEPQSSGVIWYAPDFDDSSWETGAAPFRYGDGEGGTVLTDMKNNYSSFYLRTTLTDTLDIEELNFIYDYDDGFILYFNGQEVLNFNGPDNPQYNSFATSLHESGNSANTIINANDLVWKEINTIAVQVFNYNLSSSDAFFDLKLEAKKLLPHAEAPIIDMPGGIYYEPFTATIYPRYPGDSVYYTLDGSDPLRSENAFKVADKTEVLIDPNSTYKRGKTPGVVLTVKTVKQGYNPSYQHSTTYLFIEEVKNQKNPGWVWPQTNISNQIFDYEMDADVMTDSRYKDSIDLAMESLPSMMLTVDFEDLCNENTGIYVNANNRGYEWERPANLELIDTDGYQKFRVGAGVRMRGGSSRSDSNPKHSWRLFFRSEYGNSKLKYKLFGDAGTKKFDKLDFRTAQNYSWSFKGSNLNTMNRDVFSRDIQRDMQQPHTRSRYYHLYLNGLYMGLFETQERCEARFAESYFGGKDEDYDVIKVARDAGTTIEATDGNLDLWKEVYDLCDLGFTENDNYYKLMGLNSAGERDTSLNVLVDIDNLIDYMMVIFSVGNYDAPISQFFSNKKPNNFYAVCDRTDKNEGFMFFSHDAEHSLKNITENRVNIAYLVDKPMERPEFQYFHPQWLHHQLTFNEEYKMRFADRAYDLLYNDGLLTPEANKQRFMERAKMIETAIIAESARWGDAKSSSPRNKQDDWLPIINRIANDYFSARTDEVIKQLKDIDLLPSLDAPLVYENDKKIIAQKTGLLHSNIRIENPGSQGNTVYSLDGNDPRNSQGQLTAPAKSVNGSVNLEITEITHLNTRIKYALEWSPLRNLFLVPEGYDVSDLKLTEVHYHPKDTFSISGKQLEFIEIKNTGNSTLDLMGISFTKGIKFTYENHVKLKPDSFSVIASNALAFEEFYGTAPHGEYKKSLANGGEELEAKDALDNPLFYMVYQDTLPWPSYADGVGYSMVSFDTSPVDDPNHYYYWRASFNKGGSPFADDVQEEPDAIKSINDAFAKLMVYPNPARDLVYIANEKEFENDLLISIRQLNGSILSTVQYPAMGTNSIQISLAQFNLVPGIYLMDIQTRENKKTIKLMVQ